MLKKIVIILGVLGIFGIFGFLSTEKEGKNSSLKKKIYSKKRGVDIETLVEKDDIFYNSVKRSIRVGGNSYYGQSVSLSYKEKTSLFSGKVFDNYERLSGEIKDGKKDGKWSSYYDNNFEKKEAEGYYVNNKKENEWIFYYKNGNISQKRKYENDYIIENTYFDKLGKEIGKLDYPNDKINGIYIERYSNENIKNIKSYKISKNDGEWIFYNKNGNILEKKYYIEDELKSTISFDNSGKEIGRATYKDKKIFDGKYAKRNEKNIKSIISYKNGLKDGIFIDYYYGGSKTKKIENYKNGKKNGEFTNFYENGNIKSKEYYKNSIKDGKHTYYQIDGKLESELIYKDGKAYGKVKIRDSKGNVDKIEEYKGNIKEVYEYNSKGKISSKEIYRNNEYIERYSYSTTGKLWYKKDVKKGETKSYSYHKNGNIRSISNKINSSDNIKIIYYDKNEKKIAEGNKVNDDCIDGKFVNYYTNDSVSKISFYENKIIIKREYYDLNGEKSTGFYKNGLKYNGEFYIRSYEGELLTKESFKDGKGKHVSYFIDGEIDTEGQYENSKRFGEWTFYKKDGSIFGKGTYKDGKKYNGTFILRNASGIIIRKEVVNLGTSKYYNYDSSGNIRYEGKLVNGINEGKWIYHNEKNIKTVYTYKNGIKINSEIFSPYSDQLRKLKSYLQ